MILFDNLLTQKLGNLETVDIIGGLLALVALTIIVRLIYQSVVDARDIKTLEDSHRRFELRSEERSATVSILNTAIVLAGAAFTYYQFIYTKRERDEERFEKAAETLFSPVSSPLARILAMDKLKDWTAKEGADEKEQQQRQNQVAGIIVEGLRNWAQATDLDLPRCENGRNFKSGRVSSDTAHAINTLKNMEKRTIFLDLSKLVLKGIDFSGTSANERANMRFASFSGADLSEAKLNFVDLVGANFYCANLYAAELKGSLARKPEEADLRIPQEIERTKGTSEFNTNFVQTRMQKTKLQGTDFTDANMRDADMKEATVDAQTLFDNTEMQHAILEGLTGKTSLAHAKLENACVDEDTWAKIKPNEAEKVRLYPSAAPPAECQAPKYGKD